MSDHLDDPDMALAIELAGPEPLTLATVVELAVLHACVARLARPGFAAPPRILFALAEAEIPALAGSVRLLEEVQVTLAAPRLTALPKSLGTLWLSEEVGIDLIALPLSEAYAPLWSLVLPGASAVVLLTREDGIAMALLKARGGAHRIKLIDAQALVSPLDIASQADVAVLLAAAIRAAAEP